MNVRKERHRVEQRNVISIMEIVDAQTGEKRTLFEMDQLIEAPNWLADGKRLVYNANGHLYLYDIEQGTHTCIHSGFVNHCNNDHVLSPDQQRIGVSHHTAEDGQSRIYTLPLAGGEPTLITPMAPSYLHGWSPDGKTLVYCAQRDGEYDIYTIPAQGGEETQLTTAQGLDDGAEYSPCGKYIWFNSVRSGLMQIWRMLADGSMQTQMTFHTDANSWFAHLSPDGNKVAYILYHKGDLQPWEHLPNKNVEIHVMDSDGHNDVTLVRLFGGQGTLNVNSWSPDSRQIAFVSYQLK